MKMPVQIKIPNFKTQIIGSKALKHWFPDFNRIPNDTDIICTKETFEEVINFCGDDMDIIEKVYGERDDSKIVKFKHSGTPMEYLFSDGVASLELILNQLADESGFATPEVLYSLKKAHISFPAKFDKHIKDLMFLRGKLRIKKQISMIDDLESESDLLDTYPALTHMHFLETEKRYGKLKTPKMNQSTEEFFGKSKKFVKSYYTHDNMHKAIAIMHTGEPVYLDMLKDGSEVETDHEKWKKLHIQQKIWAVMEEAYVIALERKILPGLFEEDKEEWDVKDAFMWALMRICTTLCDGFFREFAVRAYQIICNQFNPSYVTIFFKEIQQYEKEESGDTVGDNTTNGCF